MGDEFVEATPEDKLKIASHFILSSPTGEVDDVIADVKTLMGKGSLLTDTVIEKLLKQYNTDNLAFAPLGDDGKNLVVSKYGLVDGNFYLDPSTGKKYEFDHVNRKWNMSSAQVVATKTPQSNYRSTIESAIKKYMEEFYMNEKENACVVYDKDGEIIICITAKRVSLGNFWSGGWKSVYTIDVTKGGIGKLKCHVNVNVHYFEEGNVQLNSKYDEEDDIHLGDPKVAGEEIVATIKKMETRFQKNMEDMYLNMHTQTFKAMRRFLPITKNKMDWNPNAHRIVSQMNK